MSQIIVAILHNTTRIPALTFLWKSIAYSVINQAIRPFSLSTKREESPITPIKVHRRTKFAIDQNPEFRESKAQHLSERGDFGVKVLQL